VRKLLSISRLPKKACLQAARKKVNGITPLIKGGAHEKTEIIDFGYGYLLCDRHRFFLLFSRGG
jgi:hypothetical protein